jgi:multidrug efflux pump subunit AcrB
MTGVGRQMFVPLSLAVGLAMISSYLLSSTLVPVLSAWLLRAGSGHRESRLVRLYGWYLEGALRFRWPLAAVYTLSAAALLFLLYPRLGTEVFPETRGDQFQLRLRAATGTRIERTELIALKALELVQAEAGKDSVAISTGFIGVQPASYPINTIHLFTSGPHEAVLKVALKPGAAAGEPLRERLRARFQRDLPGVALSFEPGDIIGQVMSFGAAAPIEVAVQGPNLAASRAHAEKVKTELAKLPFLRDLQFVQPLDYPTYEITIDREKAGQFGLTMRDVARSLVAGSSSSRFTDPNYWRDPNSGNAFQIQVEIPQHRMQSSADIASLPVMSDGRPRPLLGDLAQIKEGKTAGLVERYNMQRVASLTANLHGISPGAAAREIRAAAARAGEPPRGISVQLRGQIPPLDRITSELQLGLLLALAAIFILLAAYFQSVRVALAVLAVTPAVLLGSAAALHLTGTTLNIQSFLGAIMATGIATANSILFCSFAEPLRRAGQPARTAAAEAGRGRSRAILMTAAAMTAGMVPLALGLGEAGAQTAPLGRAAIGGLILATFATLTVLPASYAVLLGRAPARSASLDPDDPESVHYEQV